MEYLSNPMSKPVVCEITNNYILKVNSRDRDISREPNPFNFDIKFNKTDTKYTIYYERGYWGSGNKYILNNEKSITNWKLNNGVYSKTFYINNGAIIEDQIEEISDINVTEIVAPRFIPETEIGYLVDGIEAISNPRRKGSVLLKSVDNAKVKFIFDDVSDPTYGQFPLIELTDVYCKKQYLIRTSDLDENNDVRINSINIRKDYNLFNNYFTDTIYLNNKIYKINDISNGFMDLYHDDNTIPDLDFINSTIRFPRYYQDVIWYQPNDTTGSDDFPNLSMSVTSGTNGKITIDQSGESLITSEFVKGSILEVEAISGTPRSIKRHYFEITSVNLDLDFSKSSTYNDTVFDNENKTITLYNVENPWIQWFLNAPNNLYYDNNKIIITGTTNNNSTFTIINAKNLFNNTSSTKSNIQLTVSQNVTSETTNATVKFVYNIKKIFPKLNLNEEEFKEIESFLPQSTDTTNSYTRASVTFNGKWIYNKTAPDVDSSSPLNAIKINHLKYGSRDLLNEKLFYLSLEPITPSRNLITNSKLNNVIGVFYPSSQSKNYIYLTGRNKQSYHNNNLQNLRKISFKLYFMDGTLVGQNLNNYSIDYLEKNCRQTNITFQLEQTKRIF